MTDTLQRPTAHFPNCNAGQAHDWRVSAWVEFEVQPEPAEENPKPKPVCGRSASSFYCAHCLAQVDAALLYAGQPAEDPEERTEPGREITPRRALSVLAELSNEAAQVMAGEFGELAADQAQEREAALDWAIAQLKPKRETTAP